MYSICLPKVASCHACHNSIIKYKKLHHAIFVFSVSKSVSSWSYCCYGNQMCHENENKGFTDDWAVFDTMVVASRDKEW